jgi:hypothetical protein
MYCLCSTSTSRMACLARPRRPQMRRPLGVISLEAPKTDRRRDVCLNRNADAVLDRRWIPHAEGYVFGSWDWNTTIMMNRYSHLAPDHGGGVVSRLGIEPRTP